MNPHTPGMAKRGAAQPLAGAAGSHSRRGGRAVLLLGALVTLGACAVPVGRAGQERQGVSEEIMAQLVTMAAPYQDLQSVELRPEDGCYWYRHAGPVETTMLPLRTSDGSIICGGSSTQVAG